MFLEIIAGNKVWIELYARIHEWFCDELPLKLKLYNFDLHHVHSEYQLVIPYLASLWHTVAGLMNKNKQKCREEMDKNHL